jgi:hypothetical protein
MSGSIEQNRSRAGRRIAALTPCQRVFDSIFASTAVPECDSKTNLADKSVASPQLIVNFSFTNQRADSFSPSGVNLEAKV